MAFWKMDVAESLKVRLERSADFVQLHFPCSYTDFAYSVILDCNYYSQLQTLPKIYNNAAIPRTYIM